MLISYNVLLLIFVFLILLTLVSMLQTETKENIINPLNYSQEKNNVYTYLDHKVFIRNPEMLKFIDSIIYYIDISPPLYLQFIDELNRFYKNIWIINKLLDHDSVQNINDHITIIIYEYKRLLQLFNSFSITMPPDLLDRFYAQQIVFETILKEQTEVVCNKVNHFNFDNKCLTRYSTNDLDSNQITQSKLQQSELMFV